MPNFSFKKILPILIIVLLAGAAVYAGIKIFRGQKAQQEAVKQEQEKEIIKASCLEETAKMPDEQLVEKINTLSAQNEGSEQLSEIRRQMVGYLFCLVEKNGIEESYNIVRNLMEKLQIAEENKKTESLENLKNQYSQFPRRFVFSWKGMLALGDLTDVCPDKLPDKCAEIVLPFLSKTLSPAALKKEADWCKNVCNLINQYSENKDELEKEVINFKEWNANSAIQRGQYITRYALAYRFGGKEAALKVCDNVINAANREDCVLEVNILLFEVEKMKTIVEQCVNQRKGLGSLICSVPE